MKIPKEVTHVIAQLKQAGYEAYIVGGCVRDLLLGSFPGDWDVATSATPEEIQKVFPDSFYENSFLTVTARTGSEAIPEVEITTYRLEAQYSDKRHPDQVRYAKTLEEDVSRRDFTVNAMAMDDKGKVLDLVGGQEDLKKKVIRTVGNPDERFSEDALRMLRAVRFSATLGFSIEEPTAEAVKKHRKWLEAVSKERIRDEFVKIIMADRAAEGVDRLRELGLLPYIMPELVENVGVGQNKHHIYDCYTHALKALEYSAKKKCSPQVRLASLLHDIAKPRVKAGDGIDATFYNHEVVGANMAFEILTRLKFPKKDVERVAKLVRYHLFYYNVGEVSESSVRRLVRNVGPENMDDLLRVRQADRIGSGVPKAEPYKLRHLKYLIEKVSKDPISVKMLKVDGKDVMRHAGIVPGPRVGQMLDALLGVVLEDPKKNQRETLLEEVAKLADLGDKELAARAAAAKEDTTELQTKEDEAVKSKYWVK